MIRLPDVLLNSDDFSSLNPRQRESMHDRLSNYDELAEVGEAAEGQSDAEFVSSVDDIELDIYSSLAVAADTESVVSAYRVHSSWTFECDRSALATHVSPETSHVLSISAYRVTASLPELKSWTKQWALALRSALVKLRQSSSFTEAIAQLIAIDALVSHFLIFAAAVRLNKFANA